MNYPEPEKLFLPVSPYRAGGDSWKFKDKARSRLFFWAIHLGDDVMVESGTQATAIGRGQVVWSGVKPGEEGKTNWGGLVIIGHTHRLTKRCFFSLYGHLSEISVAKGDVVVSGQQLGVVAEAGTEGSGGCKVPHLHFGVYVGPWRNKVLPGWWKLGRFRTRVGWWRDPRKFIEKYSV